MGPNQDAKSRLLISPNRIFHGSQYEICLSASQTGDFYIDRDVARRARAFLGLCGGPGGGDLILVAGRLFPKNSPGVTPKSAASRSIVLARTSFLPHSTRWYHFKSVPSKAAACSCVIPCLCRSSRSRAAMNSSRDTPQVSTARVFLEVSVRTPFFSGQEM